MKYQKAHSKSLILMQPIQLSSRHNTDQVVDQSAKVSKAKQNIEKLKMNLNRLKNPIKTPKIGRSSERKNRRQAKNQVEKELFRLQAPSTSSSSSGSDSDDSVQLKDLARSKLQKINSFSNKQQVQFLESLQNDQSEKIAVNVIRTLEHNQESKDIEETMEGNHLNINFKSSDIFQFIRYQNEIQEMIRKSETFVTNRQLQEDMVFDMEQYEIYKVEQKKRKDDIQRALIADMLAKEETKKTLLLKSKTKKVDNIAMKFIDENKHHSHQFSKQSTQQQQFHLIPKRR